MTSSDIIKFNIDRKWREARIKFLTQQKETISKLSSTLSDEPRGSRTVNDKEAEILSDLLDQIKKLEDEINSIVKYAEPEIRKELDKIESKYAIIIYRYYINGEEMKNIAKDLHYDTKYAYKLKDLGIEIFDKKQKEKKKVE